MTRRATMIAGPHRCGIPLVREFFERLSRTPHSLTALTPLVGVGYGTLRGWRCGTDPRLSLFLSALNAIGLTLKIVPLEKPEAQS